MAKALELAVGDMSTRNRSVLHLRQAFLGYLQEHAKPIVLNGAGEDGLPHTVNVSFPGCRSDSILINLDMAGVACSAGSACSSGSLLPSPVLRAMGAPQEVLRSSVRFSLSPFLEIAEIQEAAQLVAQTVSKLRKLTQAFDAEELASS
jgi:cysteine desulfurase